MSVFHHEKSPNSSNKYKFMDSAVKHAFSGCYDFDGRLSSSSVEEDYHDDDPEQDHEVLVSVIRSRAMEAKLRRKTGFSSGRFSLFLPPTNELFMAPHVDKQKGSDKEEDEEAFYSVGSSFSCSSSDARRGEFCSGLEGLDLPDFSWRRRSVMQELCNCEGWPFGLCRKVVLLPPLPKSPSESWSWRKGTRRAPQV